MRAASNYEGFSAVTAKRAEKRRSFPVTSGARGIEINTLFGATIEPGTGYHPYQSPGLTVAAFVRTSKAVCLQ
jgi:hypothetical protein